MAITMSQIESVTYRQSIEQFVESADWLTESDLPALRMALGIATKLDSGITATPAMVSQYRQLMGQLQKNSPKKGPAKPTDPLSRLLDDPAAFAAEFMQPPQVIVEA